MDVFKLGFITDNFFIDKPTYFYLKWHVIEHNVWFFFLPSIYVCSLQNRGQVWKIFMFNMKTILW